MYLILINSVFFLIENHLCTRCVLTFGINIHNACNQQEDDSYSHRGNDEKFMLARSESTAH